MIAKKEKKRVKHTQAGENKKLNVKRPATNEHSYNSCSFFATALIIKRKLKFQYRGTPLPGLPDIIGLWTWVPNNGCRIAVGAPGPLINGC